MITKFTTLQLDVGNGYTLWLDGNSKITAGDGNVYEPVANALSLPAPSCCPGSTDRCRRSCYTIGLRKHNPDMAAKYEHNRVTLEALFLDVVKADFAASCLAAYIDRLTGFRWHVSGDVFSEFHARWISLVASKTTTKSWIYSRSLLYIKYLTGNNLVVNVSADRDNYADAKHVASLHGCRLTYLCDDGHVPTDLPEGSVIFPDYGFRGRELDDPHSHYWYAGLTQLQRKAVCPADFYGQSETFRCGPCRKCLKPTNRKDSTDP